MPESEASLAEKAPLQRFGFILSTGDQEFFGLA